MYVMRGNRLGSLSSGRSTAAVQLARIRQQPGRIRAPAQPSRDGIVEIFLLITPGDKGNVRDGRSNPAYRPPHELGRLSVLLRRPATSRGPTPGRFTSRA